MVLGTFAAFALIDNTDICITTDNILVARYDKKQVLQVLHYTISYLSTARKWSVLSLINTGSFTSASQSSVE